MTEILQNHFIEVYPTSGSLFFQRLNQHVPNSFGNRMELESKILTLKSGSELHLASGLSAERLEAYQRDIAISTYRWCGHALPVYMFSNTVWILQNHTVVLLVSPVEPLGDFSTLVILQKLVPHFHVTNSGSGPPH